MRKAKLFDRYIAPRYIEQKRWALSALRQESRMTISNRSPTVSYVHTKAFSCAISTLPGLLKSSTAIILADSDGNTIRKIPVAKAYLKRGFPRATIHSLIAISLDRLGDQNLDLKSAIERTFFEGKTFRGYITDYMVDQRDAIWELPKFKGLGRVRGLPPEARSAPPKNQAPPPDDRAIVSPSDARSAPSKYQPLHPNDRAIVRCAWCDGQVRLPAGKMGDVTCPHCGKKFVANTQSTFAHEARLERQIGPRGSTAVGVDNLSLVQDYLAARGVPSAVVKRMRLDKLWLAYNREAYLQDVLAKVRECGEDVDLEADQKKPLI
jgi:hypothetical protein